MFSSFLRLFGSPTNAALPIATNSTFSETQSFTAFALASPYPLVKLFGEIVANEPYAFFVLTAGLCFTGFLFLRWLAHLTYLRSRGAGNQLRRIINDGLRFFLSWRFLTSTLLLAGVLLTGALRVHQDVRHFIRLVLFSLLLYILYKAVCQFTKAYFRKIAVFPNRRGFIPKSRNLRLLGYRFLQGLWVIVFIAILLGLWGVQIGSILAGLGIAGVVAGLAMQDAFSHLVGGVSLMLDEAYSVNDVVKLENGIEGIIFEIGLRSTKIRTWDEEIVSVPNGVLSKMTITNMSQPIERKRVRLIFQVDAASASPETITKVLYEAVDSSPDVLSNPAPCVTLLEIKANALIFRTVFYVDSVLIKVSTADIVLRAALEHFEKHHIKLIPDESLVHIADNK